MSASDDGSEATRSKLAFEDYDAVPVEGGKGAVNGGRGAVGGTIGKYQYDTKSFGSGGGSGKYDIDVQGGAGVPGWNGGRL